jgi:hypothetical protein
LFRTGVLRLPGRDRIERADLAGSFDLIAFSHFSTLGVRAGKVVAHPSGAPVSPLGHGIWADGVSATVRSRS